VSKISLFKEGFYDARMIDAEENQMSNEVVNKIVEIYQRTANNSNFTSSHWLNRNKGKVFNRENLVDFRRASGLSNGLDDRWIGETNKLLIDVLTDVPYDFLLKSCPKKNIGNSPDVIRVKDRYASGNDLVHIHWAYTLLKQINTEDQEGQLNFCEIGGGFGSLCRIIFGSANIVSYTIVELPLSACLAAYYLSMSLDVTVKLDGEEVFRSTASNRVINIYTVKNTSWMDQTYDVMINTRSMMEMNTDTIKYYFDAIHNACRVGGYFLNINRYHKDSVGEDIEIAEFPYDKKWQVIESRPPFKQDWIHYLLTRRVQENSDIYDELSRLKRLTKTYKKMTKVMLFRDRLPRSLRRLVTPAYVFFRKRF